MRRARHAEGSPRESGQGLTTPMPWPCSGLHAAQAPVRPRHCTQALLQQLDQFILSNTLPRPASSSVRLRRWPLLRPRRPVTSRRRRRRRFAEGLWRCGPKCECVGIGQRFPVMMWTDRHTPPPLFLNQAPVSFLFLFRELYFCRCLSLSLTLTGMSVFVVSVSVPN